MNRFLVVLLWSLFSLSAQTVEIESMYATSTAYPSSSYGLHNLFDQKSTTFWSTAKGTGAEEGIMLYLKKPVVINGLKLSDMTYDKSMVSGYETYINGKRKNIKYNNTKVRSLFIKFKRKNRHDFELRSGSEDYQISSAANSQNVKASELQLLFKGVPYTVTLPQKVSAEVSATSTLSPVQAYGIHNLFDARKEFTWCEGVDGDGIGEKITFRFTSEQSFNALKIRNGYQRSPKHFTANARLKKAVLESNGQKDTLLLKDTYSNQLVKLPETITTSEFSLTILESYKGSKYADLCISELSFVNGDRSFTVDCSEQVEQRRAANLKAFANTPLEKLVDRVISKEHISAYEGYIDESSRLILRSDNTFVYYSEVNDQSIDRRKEIVADGNWKVVSSEKERARIRLFGQWLNVSEIDNVYTGTTKSSYQRIFQDFINIKTVNYSAQSSSKPYYMHSAGKAKYPSGPSRKVLMLGDGKFLNTLYADGE